MTDEKNTRKWPNVKPLVRLQEPKPYPIDELPDLIRNAVVEVENRVMAPTALIGACALSTVSLATQAHINVARDEKLIGPVSLYMLSLGESGERKTAIDGQFTRAIIEYQVRIIEEKALEMQQYNTELKSHNAKCSGLLGRIKQQTKDSKPTKAIEDELQTLERNAPIQPIVPRLLMNDATQEALLYRLAKKWPSGGIFSDEGGTVFGGHGMGKDSIMRNLATINTVWGGGTLQVERRTSESFNATNPRLTVHIQVQGAALQVFLETNGALARGSGFLSRFLIADPMSTQGSRLYKEPLGSDQALDKFNARISQILNRDVPMNGRGELEPALMHLSPKAKRVWVEFHNRVERKLATGCEFAGIRDAASKSADNAVRLAALFSYFETEDHQEPISETHMRSGVAVAEWHLYETKSFFSRVSLTHAEEDIQILDEWLVTQCKNGATDKLSRRYIQQRGPNRTREKNRLDRALATLTDLGRVFPRKIGSTNMVLINPALIEK